MPLYEYECPCGREFDRVLPIAECDSEQTCECGNIAKKVITLGHGGIWRTGDELPWVRDVAMVLNDVPDDPRPNPNIKTVQDLRNYYATHPQVRPKESHPAFPSSFGDFTSRTDPAYTKQQRSKKAHEKLRELRSINVSSRPS